MLKQKVLRVLNLILVLDFIVIVAAQLVYQFHPELNGEESVLRYHAMGGYLFVILVIIHFILNFPWVKNAYFKKKKK
ncbi:hypothetical protein ACFLYK_01205 [Candidatus Cloacimonadota bacterium]